MVLGVAMDVKDEKKKGLVIAGITLIIVCSWWFLSGRNDASDYRDRADETREQLTDARTAQQDQTAALNRATREVDNSQSAVSESKKRSEQIQDIERTDSEIITECKSILAEVRRRGQTQN